MGIKRYFSTADTTITNAFEKNLITRGTGSNMGSADVLETFVIHGQTTASISAANAEEARILIKFPTDDILTDKTAGKGAPGPRPPCGRPQNENAHRAPEERRGKRVHHIHYRLALTEKKGRNRHQHRPENCQAPGEN